MNTHTIERLLSAVARTERTTMYDRNRTTSPYLPLATTYKPARHVLGGWLLSEKLDGTRCYWDGGRSRGQHIRCVHWSNKSSTRTQYSTGLWSRAGNPILAPDSFLESLPSIPLDGELWAGRGTFSLGRSILQRKTIDPRFLGTIRFAVFSTPSQPNFANEWVSISNLPLDARHAFAIRQYYLPLNERQAGMAIAKGLRRVLTAGGEGLIARNPLSAWKPGRTQDVLKIKYESQTQ